MAEGERERRRRFDALLGDGSTVYSGTVREITVTWGTGASAWIYTVSYSGLATTPAPATPEDARPLMERLRAAGK